MHTLNNTMIVKITLPEKALTLISVAEFFLNIVYVAMIATAVMVVFGYAVQWTVIASFVLALLLDRWITLLVVKWYTEEIILHIMKAF